jgi:hypothetical protein
LVLGTVMGSGCALSAEMHSTPLVTSEANAVPYSDLGLPVVAFAEVFAMTLDVSASPVTIPMTSKQAKADTMDPGSLADSVAKVLVASTGSGEASGKTVHKSSPAKGLLRQGFLGLSPTSSLSVMDAKEVCSDSRQQLGTPPFLTVGSIVSSCGAVEMGMRLRLSHPGMTNSGTPIYSSVSKSQKGYSQRVKNNIGKQLIKNKKNLLAFVVDTLAVEEEGFSEGVLDAMELAPTLCLTVENDEKKLECCFCH